MELDILYPLRVRRTSNTEVILETKRHGCNLNWCTNLPMREHLEYLDIMALYSHLLCATTEFHLPLCFGTTKMLYRYDNSLINMQYRWPQRWRMNWINKSKVSISWINGWHDIGSLWYTTTLQNVNGDRFTRKTMNLKSCFCKVNCLQMFTWRCACSIPPCRPHILKSPNY